MAMKFFFLISMITLIGGPLTVYEQPLEGVSPDGKKIIRVSEFSPYVKPVGQATLVVANVDTSETVGSFELKGIGRKIVGVEWFENRFALVEGEFTFIVDTLTLESVGPIHGLEFTTSRKWGRTPTGLLHAGSHLGDPPAASH